jgi:hypothetical protein
MSSFHARRNVDNRGGWFPSIFGMNPFNMMSSKMSDIFDPINHDIDQLLDRSLHWIDVPAGRQHSQTRQQKKMSRQQVPIHLQHIHQQQLPKQHKQQMPQMKTQQQQQQQLQCKMPQKFRILIDCSCCDPKTLKTHIKTINDQKHLIVCADEKKKITTIKKSDTSCHVTCTTKFKRTYTLPKQVDVNKMISFVTPNGQFVVEFPLQEVPCCLDIDMCPKIEKTDEGRIVSLRVPIPKSVDPSKVTLCVKGCEVILRFEERFGTDDCVSRVYFYNRCCLPEAADLNKIKCCADKHRLIITAPIRTDSKTWQTREIPIQRKIRHKTLLASGDDDDKISGKKQMKKNLSSSNIRSKSPITGDKKKTSIKTTDQKQKSNINKTDQQKQKSPSKDMHERTASSDKNKQKKKSSMTGEDKTSGSDILKSVFGSSDKSDKSDKKDKKNKSGDMKSEFPSLPSDGNKSESHHQQQ